MLNVSSLDDVYVIVSDFVATALFDPQSRAPDSP